MSRSHPSLPDTLPNQTIELVDPRHGPRLVELTVSGKMIHRRYGPVGTAWQTHRTKLADAKHAWRAASAQVARLLARGYEVGGRNLELEAEIAAAPEDPAPYLVYADWLGERGNPLGEYISVAVALDERPDDPALAARERELIEAHALALVRPHWAAQVRWRFGFVEGIELGPDIERALARHTQDTFRLPVTLEHTSSRGHVYRYQRGGEVVDLINSIRRYPMGGFVRRLYTSKGVYSLRRVEASEPPAWELTR